VVTPHGATDRAVLARQYATDGNLAARQAIHQYQQEPGRFPEWVLDIGALAGDERVIDVGAGNGIYESALARRGHRGAVVASDLSTGMLVAARERVTGLPVATADAQALPFPDASADVVLAPHMLYHVPDQAAAVRELRRVLRPGGVALVTTCSTEHMREIDDLMAEAVDATSDDTWKRLFSTLPFVLEDGDAVLRTAFDDVEVHRRDGWLVVPDESPVVDYALSMVRFDELLGDHRDEGVAALRQRVRDVIAAEGAVRIRTGVGCFACRCRA
jgi:SAM-dependent methyltransferase